MPELIKQPSRVTAAGQPPKLIDEYVGRVNTGQDGLSIAHMRSPSGWSEPGQRPEFDEFTIVLRGALVVESERTLCAPGYVPWYLVCHRVRKPARHPWREGPAGRVRQLKPPPEAEAIVERQAQVAAPEDIAGFLRKPPHSNRPVMRAVSPSELPVA